MNLIRSIALVIVIIGSQHLLASDKPNVLLLCVDDLRPELNCYGKSYIQSPHIDALAARGRLFLNHYVQAPTCGASRYAMLTGCYGPSDNNALFQRAAQIKNAPKSISPSFPSFLRSHGYTTTSIGKVSHNPGGWGGEDWDDPAKLEMPDAWDHQFMPIGPWKHPRGAMHGLANGEIRTRSNAMDVLQSTPGPDTIYPDGWITNEALEQLEQLSQNKQRPFFLAVGFIRPHLPFGSPAKYLEPYKDIQLPPIPHPEKPTGLTTWHQSGEFRGYNQWGKDPNIDADHASNVRKHYAACVSYADAQVGRVLEKLNQLQLRDHTIVILWGDHGWHLGEHAVWGKHTLFEESLKSPLIVDYPQLPFRGKSTHSIAESIDIFPTVCELLGIQPPTSLNGESLVPLLTNPLAIGQNAISYTPACDTIRTDQFRLIRHMKNGKSTGVELYDHLNDGSETKNIAVDNPKIVESLEKLIQHQLKQ